MSMRFEGYLLIIVPIAIYGLLVVLPSQRGHPLARLLSLLSAAVLVAAITLKPEQGMVDLMPVLATLIATILFSCSLAAYGYHLVALRRGNSWSLRFAFLVAGGLLGWAIMTIYQKVF